MVEDPAISDFIGDKFSSEEDYIEVELHASSL